ncbi:MAG: DUF3106 domain-containing protein [Pedosphaera sp.]|nr:DUF3106 domain-containing protein [Pedosphaera sp.]
MIVMRILKTRMMRKDCPIWLLCCLAGIGSGLGQTAEPAVITAPAVRARTEQPAASQPANAPIMRVKEKLDLFDRLLTGTPEERDTILASKTDQHRKFLRTELSRLESMTPADREVALISMRSRYYLLELVKVRPEVRQPAVAAVPEKDRQLVLEKLQRWDRLPQELQQEVLQNERTVRYVLQLDGLSTAERKKVLPTLPESLRKSWEDKLTEWKALSPERRQRISSQSIRFFELSTKERAKVLENLPEQQRRQAEESIKAFDKLPTAERAACLESVPKMFEMPEQNLDQFIDTLERWKRLSVKDRQMWKNVTTVLPPANLPPLPETMIRSAPKGENKPSPPPLVQPR